MAEGRFDKRPLIVEDELDMFADEFETVSASRIAHSVAGSNALKETRQDPEGHMGSKVQKVNTKSDL